MFDTFLLRIVNIKIYKITEPSDERSWTQDCNKTISLTREHPRASIWSPGFPRQYPDNANCLTIVTAPPGYRIVLDFEELVLENEPSYEFIYLFIKALAN